MKRFVLAIVFLAIAAVALAQDGKLYLYEPDSLSTLNTKQDKESRFMCRFNTGVAVGGFGGHAFGTGFVAPEFGYKVTDKFTLSGGFAVSYSMFSPSQSSEGRSMYGHPQYTLFAKGSYSLTPKINIYGAAAVSFNDYYNPNKPSFSGFFGADYKITEKSTISIAVSFREGNRHPLYPEYGLYPTAPTTTFSPMFQNEFFGR
ncbi:MAG: hypothetical protein IKP45_01780 [Bacteroidales bacterium]|nr:hypothetical protein [Bacteroidales bacterium]